jgi:transcriptional regulator with XRE-family HTH domain
MARLGKEQSGPMTAEEGARLRARRERIGWDVKRLAAEAGVHRTTLAALEAGEGSRGTTRAKVENALTAAEKEMGLSELPESSMPTIQAGLVEFEITGDFGVRVVARGPVENHELLAADVARIIRDIRATTGAASTTTGELTQGSPSED